MKISMKLLVLGGFLATIFVAASLMSSARAQDNSLPTPQLQRIQTSCLSTITTLNQLHASDALLRVNRGQLYESISTKLMSKFNTRLSRNNFNAADLVSATANYDHTLDTFRTDYQAYEVQLSAALRIDCTKQPAEFYNAVASARTKRAQVHADIVQLNTNIDEYQAAFQSFETSFGQITSGEVK